MIAFDYLKDRVKKHIYERREKRDTSMHEKSFEKLEGREMNLVELGREFENITGYTMIDSTSEVNRSIALKPNFEHDWETYVATYRLNHKRDLIDVVFTTKKGQNLDRIKEIPVKVQLISYISRA